MKPGQNRMVLNRHKSSDADAVYVGRPGPHGNPVELGKPCPRCGQRHLRDAAAIRCSAAVLIERLEDRSYRALVAELDGKVLVCSCAPAWCHAELLAAYSAAYAERLAICQVEGDAPEPEKLAHQSGVFAIWQNVELSSKKSTP